MTVSKRLKDFFSKLKNQISGIIETPEMELTTERENEIIEVIAQKLTNAKMNGMGFLVGSPLVPGTVWISSILLIPLAPILELFGIKGYEIAAFMNNRQAVERLMHRLEPEKL